MKKKLLSILLSLAMVITMMPAMTFTAYADTVTGLSGSGTETDPYLIGTLDELEYMAQQVNYDQKINNEDSVDAKKAYYRLIADIGNSEAGFTMTIGNGDHPFAGHFDGKGHTVTLAINAEKEAGLFLTIDQSGKVSNLTVAGSVAVTYGKWFSPPPAGGIAAYCGGEIENCCNLALISYQTTQTNGGAVGGIVGELFGGHVINCRNEGAVSGNALEAGGIAGRIGDSGTIGNCCNSGLIQGVNVGGICGAVRDLYNQNVYIKNCYHAGTIIVAEKISDAYTGDGTQGGVLGHKFPGDEEQDGVSAIIDNCFFDKTIGTGLAVCGSTEKVTVGENCSGLTTAQMKTASDTTYSGGDAVLEGKSLVDLLNGYKESDKYPDGWKKWEVVTPDSTYPTFSKPHIHKDGTADVEFEKWTSSTSLPTNPGNYYLTNDVTMTNDWEIKDNKNIVLCLNGHIINFKDNDTSGDPREKISIKSGGSLTIDDCGTTVHPGHLDANGLWQLNGENYEAQDGDINYPIKGGILTREHATTSLILVNGNFTLNGGTFAGSSFDGADCGVVCLSNTASVFNMNGGTICGNINTGVNYGTGVIYYRSNNATFIMNGGTICDNKGQEIGAINVWPSSTFIMNGGEICRNSAKKGAAVYYNTDEPVTIKLLGGKICDNVITESSGAVCSLKSITLGGDIKICGNRDASGNAKDLSLTNGAKVELSAENAPTSGMLVGIANSGPVTESNSYTDGQEKYFFADATEKCVMVYTDSHLYVDSIPTNNYKITVAPSAGGVVYTDVQYAQLNGEVTLTAVPDEGYELDHFTFTDEDGKSVEVEVTDNKFTMPAKAVTVTAEFKKAAPSIKVVKAKTGTPATEVKNPVYGTAENTRKLYDVTTQNFVSTPTLKLQWLNTTQEPETWDGDAPTGVELTTDGKITTSNNTPAGSYTFRITNDVPETIEDPNDDNKTIENTEFVSSGKIELTVEKATPNVTAWPTVTEFDYGKYATIGDVLLNNDGNANVDGRFAWDTEIASTDATVANSKDYAVVFTPTDSNYSTVSGEVNVTINKATPTLTNVTAKAIDYGKSLADSTVTGTATNENKMSENTVEGKFAFTEGTTQPNVSDSKKTNYEVTFTPTDVGNYNTATCTITIEVNAQSSSDDCAEIVKKLVVAGVITAATITTVNTVAIIVKEAKHAEAEAAKRAAEDAERKSAEEAEKAAQEAAKLLEEAKAAAQQALSEVAGDSTYSLVKEYYDLGCEAVSTATTPDEVMEATDMYVSLIGNVILVKGTKLVQNKLTANKNGKIKVSFENPELDGTVDYQVVRSTKKDFSKSKKTYTVKSKSQKTLTYTNGKSLKKGTKYYYKVRAKVELADGTTVYTKWSNVRSAKCKKTR